MYVNKVKVPYKMQYLCVTTKRFLSYPLYSCNLLYNGKKGQENGKSFRSTVPEKSWVKVYRLNSTHSLTREDEGKPLKTNDLMTSTEMFKESIMCFQLVEK